MQGNADEALNRVYRDAGGPTATLWEIPRAGHTGGIVRRSAPSTSARVVGFFDRALLGRDDGRTRRSAADRRERRAPGGALDAHAGVDDDRAVRAGDQGVAVELGDLGVRGGERADAQRTSSSAPTSAGGAPR